ncbi:MAG: hypothetical protein AMXMBFR58_27330 [Phycisphaerae bacterium]|nr:Chemotaxis response regulator protein-glutamate methylesterase [Phycisphaerales bacterium]MCK6477139.1 response regulator transcription factor [Phycisphaerales bacterium]
MAATNRDNADDAAAGSDRSPPRPACDAARSGKADTSRITVVLVDDNAMLADAMPYVIRRDPRFEWAGWVSNGASVLDFVRRAAPRIVLMDVDMPEVDTFGLVRQIVACCPESKVVMFSGHLREEYIEAAFDAGACGYLHKDDEFPSLLENLVKIQGGEMIFIPPIERGM